MRTMCGEPRAVQKARVAASMMSQVRSKARPARWIVAG
jgi:hypothetical protein